MPPSFFPIRTGFALAVILAGGAMAGSSAGSDRSGQPPYRINIPRIDAYATIDGFLNEPQWSRASVISGFYQFLPVDGRRAEDSTQVLVWYAPAGIHFGIRAYESHDAVRATLADRDKIRGDDFVQIVLDTFDDQRQALVIGVNPLGVQADGVLKDASINTSFFGSRNGNLPYRIDLNPDFVYTSKGRLTTTGYEVEIFVPFKSIRYQADDDQTWGFNVIRQIQHSGYTTAWTRIEQSSASFLSQSGQLTGLRNLNRGLVLDLSPELTSSAAGSASNDGWKYTMANPELGGNLRWGVTNNLSLNATVNPDFSQVEADVAQIQFDPRRAVFFPEKRPFFLDGIEQFRTPRSIIYTRRLANPIGAVKLTGKSSGTNIGVISGIDRKSTSLTGNDIRYFNALRFSRDIWGQSAIGIAYTDKIDGNHSNRVASVDGRLVFAEKYSVTFQGSGSFTNRGDGTGTEYAPLWLITASRSGRRFGINASVSAIHKDFNAESGFIGRTDVANATLSPRISFFGNEGSLLESFTGSLTFNGTWVYDDFVRGRRSQDRKFHISTRFGLRGGWSLGASVLIETFGYPESIYTNYYIERTDETGAVTDTVRFSGTPELDNLDYVFTFSTPRFDTFSAFGFAIYGRDENFWEWAGADILSLNLGFNWTPTEKLRVNFLYNHQQYIRPSDRSNVQIRRVPRLKTEYQLTRYIFIRLVAQYDANAVDALRDNSRTEDPILLSDGAGGFVRSEKFRSNDFRVDWLFSYRPTPGTVLFFGYGSSLSEPQSFRFQNLDRLSDGFFMKFSYLFRQ